MIFRDILRRFPLLLVLWTGFTFLGPTGLAAGGQGDTIVRLPADSCAILESLDLNPELELDYGAFCWLSLNANETQRLEESGVPFQVQEAPYTIHLGGYQFDPIREGTPIIPMEWRVTESEEPDFHLVQLVGPTRSEWLDCLQDHGLEIVQYIYPHTYVVWGKPVSMMGTRGESFVRWTGAFEPIYRVLPQWRVLDHRPHAVRVLIYRGAGPTTIIEQVRSLGAYYQGRAVLNATWEIAGFTISGTSIGTLARIPGVYSVQPVPTDGGLRGEMSNQVNAGNVDGSNLAYTGYLSWLTNLGLDGSGVVIANVDSGIDDDHPDLVNRMLSCTGDTCGGSASSNHGTHTAGIMAADGSSGVLDSYGFLRGLGMAPGAGLVEQVYAPWYTQPGGMLKLITQSSRNGAVISGNSWGPSGLPLGYDADTLAVDIGVRDADPDLAGNQSISYLLSFMNGYGGTSTQGTPDEAKNIFTIGSTKLQTSGGAQLTAINDLSSNSAHGPALDGRTIPHLVAPGCYVDSTLPDSHGLNCGTSMASPQVSGAVALFYEQYNQRFGVDPSPALVKAAFTAVAHDLAGNHDADGSTLGHPFDSKQGWGRLDAAGVLSPTVAVLYFDDPYLFDDTGESWMQSLKVADSSQPLRLMLVWTDAPGHGLGGTTPAWNNDLDLVVYYDGGTYFGNQFSSQGWSQTGGSPDGKNNTEGAFLGPAASGSLVVEVLASDINSDGVPNQGDGTDQDFALVCYNCAFPETGILTGVVRSVTRSEPISGAQVRAQTGFYQASATSEPNGAYTLTLPVGTYTVTAEATDHLSQTVGGVEILSGTITLQDFNLIFQPNPAVSLIPAGQVKEGALGDTVTHTFRVQNTGNLTDSYRLNLEGYDWPTRVLEDLGTLIPGETVATSVSVTLPNTLDRSVTDLNGDVILAQDAFTITVASQAYPGVSASAKGITQLIVQSGLSLNPPNQVLSAQPGVTITFTYTLTNTGSYTDSYSLNLSGNMWETSAPSNIGPITPTESNRFQVKVAVPRDHNTSLLGEVQIHATHLPESVIPARDTVLAQGAVLVQDAVLAQDAFTLTVVSDLDPGEDALATGVTQAVVHPGIALSGDLTGLAQVGLGIEYTFTLTNTGDYTDTFLLSVTGSWTATLDAEKTGLLGPGETASATLLVSVPPELKDGQSEVTTLTVRSSLDDKVYVSVTAKTIAIWRAFYPRIFR